MRTREIGHAAFALTRFRFVRALVASALVNVPLVLLIGCGVVAIVDFNALEAVFGLALAILLALGTLLLLTTALNVFGRLHRRLAAFLSLYGVVLFPAIFLASVVAWDQSWRKGLDPHGHGLFLFALSVSFLAASVVAIVMIVELGYLAVWCVLAPKAAYLSVRGWRPTWSEPIRNFTHQLGFPTFAAYVRRGRLALGTLYFLIALLNVAFFGLLTSPMWLPRPDNTAAGWTMATLLLAVPFGALALNLAGIGEALSKAARGRATQLYQSVREWDDRQPVLYLRAFNQDKVAITRRTRDPLLRLPAGFGRDSELDELLLEAGAPFGPLIAIGDPSNPIPPLGAARVFVTGHGENWKQAVSDLIGASRAIIICPHTTAGVAWEIEQVRAPQVLARTIVIASPSVSADETRALFGQICGEPVVLRQGCRPVAAFQDPSDGWTLLCARRLTVQTYTVALNRALQRLLRR
jgi:hypothetical protein